MKINLNEALRLALKGIDNYTNGATGEGGDRYGIYHGDTGQIELNAFGSIYQLLILEVKIF